MKANRKFVEGKDAVSAVIGVILMVAITVAIAATVYVYVSGMIGSGPSTTPTVSMLQSGSYISITGVDNGPVVNGTGQAVCVVTNQTTGVAVTGGGMIHADVAGDTANVDGGDTISINVGAQAAGTKFTVQITYAGDVVGSCVYTVP